VQGMLVVFLIVGLAERFHLLKSISNASVCLLIAALVFAVDGIKTEFFSLKRVPFLITFFLVGLIFRRFKETIFTKKNLLYVIPVFFFAYTFQIFNYTADLPKIYWNTLTLVVGVSASYLLISSNIENRSLIWLGFYSYGIYLLHVFGTASSRIFLNRLDVDNKLIHIFVALVIGIGLPILIQRLIPAKSLPAFLLFGDRLQKRTKLPEREKAPLS
jgi:peptidoglycan/LPS O-acetylase OafA/YrhL